MTEHVHILIVTGSVGVGKTRTSDAISDSLTGKAIPNAVIDMDCLRWAYPRPKDDPFHMRLGFENLASIWPNYYRLGIRHLILPSVIESRAALLTYQETILGSTVTAVRLTANIETIHRRLERREVGEALVWHRKRASEQNDRSDLADVADATVSTEARAIEEVAIDVLSLWLSDP